MAPTLTFITLFTGYAHRLYASHMHTFGHCHVGRYTHPAHIHTHTHTHIQTSAMSTWRGSNKRQLVFDFCLAHLVFCLLDFPCCAAVNLFCWRVLFGMGACTEEACCRQRHAVWLCLWVLCWSLSLSFLHFFCCSFGLLAFRGRLINYELNSGNGSLSDTPRTAQPAANFHNIIACLQSVRVWVRACVCVCVVVVNVECNACYFKGRLSACGRCLMQTDSKSTFLVCVMLRLTYYDINFKSTTHLQWDGKINHININFVICLIYMYIYLVCICNESYLFLFSAAHSLEPSREDVSYTVKHNQCRLQQQQMPDKCIGITMSSLI